MTPRARIADLFSSGKVTFGLRQNVVVALCAVAVSVIGALLSR